MTSETWIIGGSESEKRAIGALVKRSVAQLGYGHVEALVENRGPHPVATSAHAWSMEQIGDHDLLLTIQNGLSGWSLEGRVQPSSPTISSTLQT